MSHAQPTSLHTNPATGHTDGHPDGHGGEHSGPHVVPLKILFGVFAILMFFTVLTVAVTEIDLGRQMNLVLALTIAVIKATFVVLYFMHLRYDNPFNSVVFIAALFFVAIFMGVAITDTREYAPVLKGPAIVTDKLQTPPPAGHDDHGAGHDTGHDAVHSDAPGHQDNPAHAEPTSPGAQSHGAAMTPGAGATDETPDTHGAPLAKPKSMASPATQPVPH